MKLHFIAIGGAIMHQLAIVSKKNGILVSGSDDEIADPSKTNLKKESLLPADFGWFPDKITPDLDAVILGMHAKSDNPELKKAQELNIPIYSFPEYIYKLSEHKKRIAIAGSHGKTTTTSMIMHVLKDQKIDFDYLVGAKVEGFEHSVKISNAPVLLVEGDEYPASTLNKIPKIHFYHPHISVIIGIAWDHVNVFPTYENYWDQFKIFIDQMANGAILIYNDEDKEVVRLIQGKDEVLNLEPYTTPAFQLKNNLVVIQTEEGEFPLEIFGKHNLQNMEAARRVCAHLDVSNIDFYHSIRRFTGAARRLEKLEEKENFISFRDFAHAPSKLKATLQAVRERYAGHYLIACFELHTFSSLSENFMSQYAHSMDDCDAGSVFYSEHALQLKNLPELNRKQIMEGFQNEQLSVFNNKKSLRNWIEEKIKGTEKPVCLLLMSSGTFEGLELKF